MRCYTIMYINWGYLKQKNTHLKTLDGNSLAVQLYASLSRTQKWALNSRVSWLQMLHINLFRWKHSLPESQRQKLPHTWTVNSLFDEKHNKFCRKFNHVFTCLTNTCLSKYLLGVFMSCALRLISENVFIHSFIHSFQLYFKSVFATCTKARTSSA